MKEKIYVQGAPLHPNKRVMMVRKSLVLQRVERHQAGDYSCQASNSEGEGVSQTLRLGVHCEFPGIL